MGLKLIKEVRECAESQIAKNDKLEAEERKSIHELWQTDRERADKLSLSDKEAYENNARVEKASREERVLFIKGQEARLDENKYPFIISINSTHTSFRAKRTTESTNLVSLVSETVKYWSNIDSPAHVKVLYCTACTPP